MWLAANRAKAPTDWNATDWRQVQRTGRNLRQRIFRASEEGNHRKVRSLQNLMLRSHANALLAVRRVTQVNRGKNTPGVDKVIVKTPRARGELVDRLGEFTPWKAKPARRVYIPKAKGKFRPLGIPVIVDRAMQAITLNALEPEWEARFEGCSYGFRPGRGCHDAIASVYNIARPNKNKKWVLDADVKGAFDNIGHEALLQAIDGFPAKELVRQWLKAGYVEEGRFHATEAGTPQGGVVSPLLANIAFHGLEAALGVKRRPSGKIGGKRALVRYADDFLVFCETEADAMAAKADVSAWLAARGMTLSEEKTRTLHLSEGFDFLGFNIRHYRARKTSRSGWKLLIKPGDEAVKRLKAKIKAEWITHRDTRTETLINRLNPVIRGWANYYRNGVSKKVFASLDNWMFQRAVRYGLRRHPKKGWTWIKARYFGRSLKSRETKWVFRDPENPALHLLNFAWTSIERHVLVKGGASPDDPRLRDYWAVRNKRRVKELPKRQRKLAEGQEGLCPHCKGSLMNDEELHIHHVKRRVDGGTDDPSNLKLVHLYCHQQVHAVGYEHADA
jgi:RNA-directed DNA polymerase